MQKNQNFCRKNYIIKKILHHWNQEAVNPIVAKSPLNPLPVQNPPTSSGHFTTIRKSRPLQTPMAPSQLQIKVNALKRLTKEESMYKDDVEQQEKHIAQMKADNADEYEIRKQVEVLQESNRMIPTVTGKIAEHKSALESFLETYDGEEDVSIAKELIH